MLVAATDVNLRSARVKASTMIFAGCTDVERQRGTRQSNNCSASSQAESPEAATRQELHPRVSQKCRAHCRPKYTGTPILFGNLDTVSFQAIA